MRGVGSSVRPTVCTNDECRVLTDKKLASERFLREEESLKNKLTLSRYLTWKRLFRGN